MIKVIGLIVMGLISSASIAQVYKCTDADGNIVFSDSKCADDAELVQGVGESRGVTATSAGPDSSLTLADGSTLRFKEIISIEVKTTMGYKTGRTGMYVHFEGTDRLVEFDNLVSMQVLTWDRKSCGNTAHLCRPLVKIVTSQREVTTRYEALRNIKLLVDDELDGQEKEMTVWFGNENRPHIRAIRF